MPKKIGTVERDVLTNAPLPQQTNTYTVISHQYVIDIIEQTLASHGFEIVEEVYRCTDGAQVAHGNFHIKYGNDPDLGLMYTFSNSYNKSLRFKAAIGANAFVNDAYMVSDMDSWLRKHTGTADQETRELIEEHIANAAQYFDQLQSDKNQMKEIPINKQEFGSVIGQLLMNNFIGVDQISLIKKEYDNPSYNYADGKNNLWTCYLIIADALRIAHPAKWMQQQVAVHLFFVNRYNLGVFDEDETEDETTDEIQIDSTQSSQDEDILEVTEEELNHMLHGVDNNPEVVIAQSEDVEDDVEEPEQEEEVIVDTKETIEEPAKAIDNSMYFFAADYPGVNQGDIIDVDDDYYEVLNVVESEEGDLLECKLAEIDDTPEITGIPDGDTISDTDDEEPFLPIQKPESREQESVQPEPEEDPLEFDITPELPDVNVQVDVNDSDNLVREILSAEIEEIYGEVEPGFTWEIEDGMYNITLVSGEGFILSQSYVDGQVQLSS